MKPSATLRQAQAEFDVISRQVSTAHPERGGFGARMTALEDSIRGSFRTAMLILSGAVGCVLLIACVNLSNLLLARANSRRKEFAVRSALGASPWRLVRQMLIESLVLAFGGCALGRAAGVCHHRRTRPAEGVQHPAAANHDRGHDRSNFHGGTVLVSRDWPAEFCRRGNSGTVERARISATPANAAAAASPTSLLRRSLVVAEVALACVLLVAAGLLIRSFAEVLNVDLGFQSKGAVAWRADPVRAFKSLAEGNRYYDQLVEKIAAIPGSNLSA